MNFKEEKFGTSYPVDVLIKKRTRSLNEMINYTSWACCDLKRNSSKLNFCVSYIYLMTILNHPFVPGWSPLFSQNLYLQSYTRSCFPKNIVQATVFKVKSFIPTIKKYIDSILRNTFFPLNFEAVGGGI